MADKNNAGTLPMVVPQENESDEQDQPSIELQEAASARTAKSLDESQIFRDTIFTSRVLILPEGRTLRVTKGQVSVLSTDTVALAYLQARADFVALAG